MPRHAPDIQGAAGHTSHRSAITGPAWVACAAPSGPHAARYARPACGLPSGRHNEQSRKPAVTVTAILARQGHGVLGEGFPVILPGRDLSLGSPMLATSEGRRVGNKVCVLVDFCGCLIFI